MLGIALKRMPTVLPPLVGTGSRVWVDWIDDVQVILRAASRLILASWTHSLELARDAYCRFLKAPENHKTFIVATPSLFLQACAAVPAKRRRRLAAVKRRPTSETLYAAVRHAQQAGVGDLADLIKAIKVSQGPQVTNCISGDPRELQDGSSLLSQHWRNANRAIRAFYSD